MKEKVIIYALGKYWKKYNEEIENLYNIIACSDRNINADQYSFGHKFILPREISSFHYDKLIIGCEQRGVRELIALDYHIPVEKIVYFDEIMRNQRKVASNVKREHTEKLSIVIPTYNRRERLKRTLDILEMQSETDFSLIILDNCSNYDVNELILIRKQEFQEKVKLIRNKTNIGMAGNLANSFMQDVNGWLWTLADDDIPSIYAVEDIYNEIDQMKDIGIINFCIHDLSKNMQDGYKEFASLQELLHFYDQIILDRKCRNMLQGDFIYFSNKVYNVKYIRKYFEKIVFYTYSCIPQLIPLVFMLNEKAASVCISNKKIVSYDNPEGDHWDVIKIASGMRIITDFMLNLNESERSILYSLIMVDYNVLLNAVEGQNVCYNISQIKKIYNEVYQCFLNDDEKQNYFLRIKEIELKYGLSFSL